MSHKSHRRKRPNFCWTCSPNFSGAPRIDGLVTKRFKRRRLFRAPDGGDHARAQRLAQGYGRPAHRAIGADDQEILARPDLRAADSVPGGGIRHAAGCRLDKGQARRHEGAAFGGQRDELRVGAILRKAEAEACAPDAFTDQTLRTLTDDASEVAAGNARHSGIGGKKAEHVLDVAGVEPCRLDLDQYFALAGNGRGAFDQLERAEIAFGGEGKSKHMSRALKKTAPI